jgi:hypothetical protein
MQLTYAEAFTASSAKLPSDYSPTTRSFKMVTECVVTCECQGLGARGQGFGCVATSELRGAVLGLWGCDLHAQQLNPSIMQQNAWAPVSVVVEGVWGAELRVKCYTHPQHTAVVFKAMFLPVWLSGSGRPAVGDTDLTNVCIVVPSAAAAAVMVLLQSAPNLVRPKLVQLGPALTSVACLRGPDLAGLPPCPQAFIDR